MPKQTSSSSGSRTLDHYFGKLTAPASTLVATAEPSSSTFRPKPARATVAAPPKPSHDFKSDNPRARRKRVADETLAALEAGSITLPDGTSHDLRAPIAACVQSTRYYAPDAPLATLPAPATSGATTNITLAELTTLEGAAQLLHWERRARVGLLNFASATKPGGGFRSGAQAQEESIARSSSLAPALEGPGGAPFYAEHTKDKRGGFYTHAIVFTPGVVVFRDDGGAWVAPHEVDVLTCAAVNAGDVRDKLKKRGGSAEAAADAERAIERVMRERMSRILHVFAREGVRAIVLGSFGTGVFRNDVDFVARMWRALLVGPTAPFRDAFERVLFAIVGAETYATFVSVFDDGGAAV